MDEQETTVGVKWGGKTYEEVKAINRWICKEAGENFLVNTKEGEGQWRSGEKGRRQIKNTDKERAGTGPPTKAHHTNILGQKKGGR